MRRKPNPTLAARIVLDDRRSQSAGGSRIHGDLQHGPRVLTRDYPQIVDDFPEVVPVTQRELDIIETYLGSMLDDMLKRMQ